MMMWSRLSERHSPAIELVTVLGCYAAYEATRGAVAGSRMQAMRRADDIAALERRLHVFAEPNVQEAARRVPGLLGTLGVAYVTLHLIATSALLLWLYCTRNEAFPRIRTTLIVASFLSLVVFLVFPTAPPRLAGIGISDTVSHGGVDLNHGLVNSLYDPYAAVPSMHVGYALVVGAVLARTARRTALRVAGWLYPPFVLLVIVATGNHFFFDAAAGAAVVGVAYGAVWALRPRGRAGEVVPIRRAAAAGDVERAA